MAVRLRRWRLLLVGTLTLILLLVPVVPTTDAQGNGDVDWFGWGVKVDFPNNTWKVRYITYLGSNNPRPRVLREHVRDISAQCTKRGAGRLSYPTTDSAYFDGTVYMQCSLPSVRGELAILGYTPPSGDQPWCPCVLGGGPLWVDGQVKQLTRSGTMPLLDASDRGVRSSVVVNGTTASTLLEVRRRQPQGDVISYTSPPQTVQPTGYRTVVGWDGDAIVAVANHFSWLNYLVDPGWAPFFNNNVKGSTIGYWHESPSTSGTHPRSDNYELGMNGGTLYIGYSPSTGKYFTGEIDDAGLDPGCSGA